MDSNKIFTEEASDKNQALLNQAQRFNDGKLRWSLVYFKGLEPLVRVLEFGAAKYDPNQWKLGLNRTDILESLLRHATDLNDGIEYDADSGLHQIGHIMANAMFLQYFIDHPEKEIAQKAFPKLKKDK